MNRKIALVSILFSLASLFIVSLSSFEHERTKSSLKTEIIIPTVDIAADLEMTENNFCLYQGDFYSMGSVVTMLDEKKKCTKNSAWNIFTL